MVERDRDNDAAMVGNVIAGSVQHFLITDWPDQTTIIPNVHPKTLFIKPLHAVVRKKCEWSAVKPNNIWSSWEEAKVLFG